MGAPNNSLIPAAILLDHPGLTEEELIAAMDETRSSGTFSSHFIRDWGDYGQGRRVDYEDDRYHRGPIGFAEIMGLRQKFQGTLGENEMVICGVVPRKQNDVWLSPAYHVTRDAPDGVGAVEKVQEAMIYDIPRPGVIFQHKKEVDPVRYRIVRVLSKRPFISNGHNGSSRPHPDTPWIATVDAQSLQSSHTEEQFTELDALIRAYPHCDPRKMYDFSQQRGEFPIAYYRHIPWLRRDEKYYLDTDSLMQIQNKKTGKNRREELFGDIVMTAEAIKHKAWNLLCYNGGKNAQRFLADFPEARERHDRAIADFWLSQYAVTEHMTNTDLLRLRMSMRPVPMSREQENELCLARVTDEGFTWGRYLREIAPEQREFTKKQRRGMLKGLMDGYSMTECLRIFAKNLPRAETQKKEPTEQEAPF